MAAPRAHEILHHELIGLEAEVLEDSNPSNVGVRGTVVDESLNTVVIGDGRERRVAKKDAVFKFTLNGEVVKVEGRALQGRPEDRVKKTIKRRW
jgi:ribonuclease P protein subunit POP4